MTERAVFELAHARLFNRGDVDPAEGYYPFIRQARAHPVVDEFFTCSQAELIERFCSLHPAASREALRSLLATRCSHFFWAGCDFFPVSDLPGGARMLLLESNSCPAGQKSMPSLRGDSLWRGYQRLHDVLLGLWTEATNLPLAVLYDKNEQEARAYAASFADTTGRPALAVDTSAGAASEVLRIVDRKLQVLGPHGWTPVIAALRYITHKPWLQLPVDCATPILNPISACLSGGRNKHLANLAYRRFNEAWSGRGLGISFPATRSGVPPGQVAEIVAQFGGRAVIKQPYSHAGEGVWPVVSEEAVAEWLASSSTRERYVVQQMIAETHRSVVRGIRGGTIYDVRMLLANGADGFRPISIFARTARRPLSSPMLQASVRDELVTNLSHRDETGRWAADASRVVPLDEEHFSSLGLDLDDLIDAYVQSVMAVVAIDDMATGFTRADGTFDLDRFHSLNDDEVLREELSRFNPVNVA
jgi:hypothetical protein